MLIIFDLDGVLVDAKEIHRDAFIAALKTGYHLDISKEYHDKELCGLPTKVKLQRIGVHPHRIEQIGNIKQSYTISAFKQLLPDFDLLKILMQLKVLGHRLFCCSNSLANTVELALTKLAIIGQFDGYIGNDDVFSPKPSPEMYYKAMAILGIRINKTLIVEDGPVGQEAIKNSGARGLIVKNRQDLTIEKILQRINE